MRMIKRFQTSSSTKLRRMIVDRRVAKHRRMKAYAELVRRRREG